MNKNLRTRRRSCQCHPTADAYKTAVETVFEAEGGHGIEIRNIHGAQVAVGSDTFSNPEGPSYGNCSETEHTAAVAPTTAVRNIPALAVTVDVAATDAAPRSRVPRNRCRHTSMPWELKGMRLSERWPTIRGGFKTWIVGFCNCVVQAGEGAGVAERKEERRTLCRASVYKKT